MTAALVPARVVGTHRNGLGYAGLGLGILAVLTSLLMVGLMFGSLAITLGLAGQRAVDDGVATNDKSAVAATILGVVASVIAFVALIVRIGFLICRFG